jgi:hypothetical protein
MKTDSMDAKLRHLEQIGILVVPATSNIVLKSDHSNTNYIGE